MRGFAGALVAGLIAASCTTSSVAAPQASPSASPSPQTTSSVFVFQVRQDATTHFTLARPDGTVIKTVDIAGVGFPPLNDGAALLLNKWVGGIGLAYLPSTVLGPDGTVTPILESLRPYFGPGADGIGDTVTVSDQLIAGVQGFDPASYVLLDLGTGQAVALLTAKRLGPAGGGITPPIVQSLGVVGGVARILVRHADWGQPVSQWAAVEIDLKQKVVVGIHNLPLDPGVDSYDAYDPALSPDGKVFAYIENTLADGNQRAIFRTHIAEVGSGRDTIAGDTSVRLMDREHCLRFSPDGTALVAYGQDAWPDATGKANAKLVAFASVDGHVLSRVEAGDAQYNQITPVGWTAPHTLAYIVATATIAGDFADPQSSAFTLDVASGRRTALPGGFGELVAVLTH
jgi:hypothetical protein